MIQRIQTAYLLLATVLSALFLSGNIARFKDASGDLYNLTARGLMKIPTELNTGQLAILWPLILLTLLIAVISFASIFLYKNRKLQLKLTSGILIIAIFQVIVFAICSVLVMKEYDVSIVPGIKMILPVLVVICMFLAYRGIRKDENLVRSYDRL